MEIDSKSQRTPLFAATQPAAQSERSFGLRAFDAFLYPGVTNVGVFATSVFFTYLTNRGRHFGKEGSAARWIGENIFEKRGDYMRQKFMDMGMSHGFADNAKMVFWSFADGSLLAPVIKNFEDNRENIARKIDKMAGTEPDDPSVYAAEPKQGWISVLGARALTAGIVAPTAAFLNKVDFNGGGFKWAAKSGENLNKRLFYDNGIELGKWAQKRFPQTTAKMPPEAFHDISEVTLFEAFYTSVCTAGQYAFSRAIASRLQPYTPPVAAAPQASNENAAPRLAQLMKQPEAPTATVSSKDAQHEPPKETSVSVA